MRIGRNVVRIGGRRVPFERVRSKRARTLSLEYSLERGLVAVLPKGASEERLKTFMRSKREWLHDIIMETAHIDDAFPNRELRSGCRVLYLGRPHTLRISRRKESRMRVEREGGTIHLMIPRESRRTPSEYLERWLRKQARLHITERLEEWAERFDVTYQQLSIRSQKRRWGSCSTGRKLAFNWRLIMAPPRVVDYVIVHELTHIEHMSHSKTYWRKVRSRCPNYHSFEEWLDTYGPILTLEREPDLRRPHARMEPPPWGGRPVWE